MCRVLYRVLCDVLTGTADCFLVRLLLTALFACLHILSVLNLTKGEEEKKKNRTENEYLFVFIHSHSLEHSLDIVCVCSLC